MSALWHIFRLVLRDQRKALVNGALLSFVVLVMGAALLGLSGWFITAAAAAGLVGMGAVFDVFRPSAAIRFLALGRTAARYGERMLTHDATLRALETLRLRVLGTLLFASFQQVSRLRSSQALGRLTADIDALDGVPLRLVLPVVAALATHALAFALLWWLVSLPIALFSVAGWVAGGALVLVRAARRAAPASRKAEGAMQALRARIIDLVRSRDTLVAYGQLQSQETTVRSAADRHHDLLAELHRIERHTGAALAVLGTLVAGGVLWLGGLAVADGQMEPAVAALGFFTALALGETVLPLRRAAADLGRMAEAARRLRRALGASQGKKGGHQSHPAMLSVSNLALTRPGGANAILQGLSFKVRPGETVAITGPSGCGKSTLLQAIAGFAPTFSGDIRLGELSVRDWADAPLRQAVTYLPQRSGLMAGTIRDALQLANANATDAQLRQVLRAVQLWHVLDGRGGLDMVLGPRGDGLSGGEARRLTLARALLRDPAVLLLDEPTEGLDDDTAKAVLAGLRAHLPDAMIVMASHHPREAATADRTIALGQTGV